MSIDILAAIWRDDIERLTWAAWFQDKEGVRWIV